MNPRRVHVHGPFKFTPGQRIASPFSTIRRDDGSTQLTYKGRPLYTFIAGSAPGQTFGDGINAFGGLWHIARP